MALESGSGIDPAGKEEPAPPPLPGWTNRFIDYFVVCGLGAEVRTMDGASGFQGLMKHGQPICYVPDMFPLDNYPQKEHKKFGVPEGLPMVVMPTGLQFYDRGPYPDDESTQPRSYPMVLTDTVGTKVYVSVVAFRDPVDDDVAQSYGIPANHFVDKCICIVSHWPYLDTFRLILEEIHRLCFSPEGCIQPLWDTVAHLISSVPLPAPGQHSVAFSVEKRLLFTEAPPVLSLPHAQISFRTLVQSLDIENILQLFTAVLLEKRILLQASRYELLTLVAESISHLIYPFKWAYAYTPVLPLNKLELVHMPGSFLFGIVPSTWELDLPGGILLVDLDNNRISISSSGYDDHGMEDDIIPPIPEPELGHMRMAMLQLIHPELTLLDRARSHDHSGELLRFMKKWGRNHDRELRLIFLRFFASLLNGYRHFVDKVMDSSGHSTTSFNQTSFLRKRCKVSGNVEEPLLNQLLVTQSWQQFVDQSTGGAFRPSAGTQASSAASFFDRLMMELEKLDEGTGVPIFDLPEDKTTPTILTVPNPEPKEKASGRHTYNRFPTLERSSEKAQQRYEFLKQVQDSMQKQREKVSVASKQLEDAMATLQDSTGGRTIQEIERERDAMVFLIKGKILKLFDAFLALGDEEDPLSSMQYGTIFAMMEDEDGIGSTGFMECIRDKISKQGWDGAVGTDHFVALRELMILAINRATDRNDLPSVLLALELCTSLHKTDSAGLHDCVLRHLGALPVWQDLRFWNLFYNAQLETYSDFDGKYVDLVQHLLTGMAYYMAYLGVIDGDAWALMEVLANEYRISLKRQIILRSQLAQLQQAVQYFGLSPSSPAAAALAATAGIGGPINRRSIQGPPPLKSPTVAASSAVDGDAAADGGQWMGMRSAISNRWMSSVLKATQPLNLPTFQKPGDESSIASSNSSDTDTFPHSSSVPSTPSLKSQPSFKSLGGGGGGGQRMPLGMRVLRGHKQAITALHVGSRAELGDLVMEGEEGGLIISGSCDATVKLWDPSSRGSELRSTMHGHTGAIRCIGLDRTRVITSGDDKRVLVFDKASGKIAVELRGHEDSVLALRVLAGVGRGSVMTTGRDGQVKMWDIRSGHIASTVLRSPQPLLCMDYLDHAGVLAVGGAEGVCYVWDVRAGKERHQLEGHSNWIRTLCMAGDAVVTGSDDWTARIWTLTDGESEATLACHAGAVTCVEYVAATRGIITGSADCTARLWERGEGVLRCVETIRQHHSPIVSARAGEKFLAIAAADNTLTMMHRPHAPLVPPAPGGAGGGGGFGSGFDGAGRSGPYGSMDEWKFLRGVSRATDVVRQVASDVERGRICTGSRSGVLRLWDPPSSH